MRKLLNPQWLLLINTLPLILLFVLLYGQYHIIQSLLEKENISLWKTLAIGLGTLGILNFAYSIYAIGRRQKVSIWYAIAALILYITFIYFYSQHFNDIMPSSIPPWMLTGNLFLYVGTFLMPTLAYAIAVMVLYFTPENREHKAWVNLLMAIGIPLGGYVLSQLILPLWQVLNNDFEVHAFIILTIIATLAFHFFLVRAIYIFVTKKSHVNQGFKIALEIIIALVMPVLGLLVNQGYFFDGFGISEGGVFGDFNHPWFYILAIINGLLLCLPAWDNKLYRIFLFIARSITLSFTAYFFFVFLPFLPISVIAIAAIGTGFLMLCPLILMIIHLQKLIEDYQYLKAVISIKLVLSICIAGFMIIPAILTVEYLKDKSDLNKALAYVYSPDYDNPLEIDTESLDKTLQYISNQKDRRNNLMGQSAPYLSTYYNWLVLDNLTLPDAKINQLKAVFFDQASSEETSDNMAHDEVEITNILTESTYDPTQKSWKSWINLEITNQNTTSGFKEFATVIDLPEGAYICDYYLYVGDKKEAGILAEKKSAMWIFSQIRNENRDPGILYYLSGNRVAFRVFPFAMAEVRKTGIQILHKEPMVLNIDHQLISLGNTEETIPTPIESPDYAYVSSQEKQTLDSIQRQPYFHFLIDVSKNTKTLSKAFTSSIAQTLAAYPDLAKNAKISWVNSSVKTMPLDTAWETAYQNQSYQGGYFLERAIQHALIESYQKHQAQYPILVAVTDSLQHAIITQDFKDLAFTFPENSNFYHLNQQGNLSMHSLIDNPKLPLPKPNPEISHAKTVLVYPIGEQTNAYLPHNAQPNLVLKHEVFDIKESTIKEKNWASALAMQAQYRSHTLHPALAQKDWLNQVKYSFMSSVMTPYTSYLVVENEAQKAMLKKKQAQVLSGNKNLDPGEEIRRMSEPSWWLVLGLFMIFLVYRKPKKHLSNHDMF